jgi:hypothetical protein
MHFDAERISAITQITWLHNNNCQLFIFRKWLSVRNENALFLKLGVLLEDADYGILGVRQEDVQAYYVSSLSMLRVAVGHELRSVP